MAIVAPIAPYAVAGRKFTEVRSFQPNSVATLGCGFVHYYWLIGFYWLLKPAKIDGPVDFTTDHP